MGPPYFIGTESKRIPNERSEMANKCTKWYLDLSKQMF